MYNRNKIAYRRDNFMNADTYILAQKHKKEKNFIFFYTKKNTNKILKTRNISEAIIMMLKIHVTYWYISL